MLETILNYIHNHFPIQGAEHYGAFQIVSGTLNADFLKNGQYYLITGSIFNDGLHRFGYDGKVYVSSDENDVHPNMPELQDESFVGRIIPLAIPREIIKLSAEIKAWRANNPETDKVSESFGGYSYSRAQTTQNGTSSVGGWQAVYGRQLNKWRKPYE